MHESYRAKSWSLIPKNIVILHPSLTSLLFRLNLSLTSSCSVQPLKYERTITTKKQRENKGNALKHKTSPSTDPLNDQPCHADSPMLSPSSTDMSYHGYHMNLTGSSLDRDCSSTKQSHLTSLGLLSYSYWLVPVPTALVIVTHGYAESGDYVTCFSSFPVPACFLLVTLLMQSLVITSRVLALSRSRPVLC